MLVSCIGLSVSIECLVQIDWAASLTASIPMTKQSKNHIFTFRWFAWRIGAIILLSTLGLMVLSWTAQKPDGLGVVNGRLAKCPDTPNCVSSQSESEAQRMPAIEFAGPAADQVEKIKLVVANKFPRAKLVSESEYYLHFEFRSLVFRFVDDVEFLVDDEQSLIHFRSAARVGHSDMGTNRKRMSRFAQEFANHAQ